MFKEQGVCQVQVMMSPGAIYYTCSIVIYCNRAVLSPAIFEIMVPNKLDLSRSRDVIGHLIIQFAICRFLFMFHWNRISISNRF